MRYALIFSGGCIAGLAAGASIDIDDDSMLRSRAAEFTVTTRQVDPHDGLWVRDEDSTLVGSSIDDYDTSTLQPRAGSRISRDRSPSDSRMLTRVQSQDFTTLESLSPKSQSSGSDILGGIYSNSGRSNDGRKSRASNRSGGETGKGISRGQDLGSGGYRGKGRDGGGTGSSGRGGNADRGRDSKNIWYSGLGKGHWNEGFSGAHPWEGGSGYDGAHGRGGHDDRARRGGGSGRVNRSRGGNHSPYPARDSSSVDDQRATDLRMDQIKISEGHHSAQVRQGRDSSAVQGEIRGTNQRSTRAPSRVTQQRPYQQVGSQNPNLVRADGYRLPPGLDVVPKPLTNQPSSDKITTPPTRQDRASIRMQSSGTSGVFESRQGILPSQVGSSLLVRPISYSIGQDSDVTHTQQLDAVHGSLHAVAKQRGAKSEISASGAKAVTTRVTTGSGGRATISSSARGQRTESVASTSLSPGEISMWSENNHPSAAPIHHSAVLHGTGTIRSSAFNVNPPSHFRENERYGM